MEVTSGSRWARLQKDGTTLDAPNTTRYLNMFKGLTPGDFVLHYLTTALTHERGIQSSVVGVSKVTSEMKVIPTSVGEKIFVKCSKAVALPKPVPYSELNQITKKSGQFAKLLRAYMQRYLTQITQSDFESILRVYPINMKRFLKSSILKKV
jgi:hypothetical protein